MAPSRALLHQLEGTGQTVGVLSEDLRGRRVLDAAGERIGTVTHLLVDDQEHRVRFLVVEHGGFLGYHRMASFVPVEAIASTTRHEVLLGHSARHVVTGPVYDPELVSDQRYQGSVYDHFGYLPLWGVCHDEAPATRSRTTAP